jgi:hypothetical protein
MAAIEAKFRSGGQICTALRTGKKQLCAAIMAEFSAVGVVRAASGTIHPRSPSRDAGQNEPI